MIRSVFRVQCDGPCRGWLSWSEDYVPGTDILPRHEVVAPTAERAFNWPGERAARMAARAAGWECPVQLEDPRKWFCPTCKLNPKGIVVPPLVRFLVTGDRQPNGVPYATADTIASVPEHVKEQVERDVRAKFAQLWPGVEITEEKWYPLYGPEDDS